MTATLTLAYLIIAALLLWHSGASADRSPMHRAMLYAFGFAAMCFGAARFLILFGAAADDWQWMIDAGHISLVAFAAMWIRREHEIIRRIRGSGQ